ncbi:tRNA lysidine(34) synthetase [Arcanobacterium hippocoleae]
MAGPHRLVAAARNVLKTEFAKLAVGAPVVLAVSGGADSMALAVSAQFAARENLIDLHAVVVDHGIRAESAAEAAEVHKRLSSLGIKAQVVRIDLRRIQKPAELIAASGINSETDYESIETLREGSEIYHESDADNVSSAYNIGANSGPEGEARSGRYRALAQIARELGNKWNQTGDSPALVMLGHNANDQAESVLLGLGRGSGARSICGMPQSGNLPVCPDVPMVRPLLSFTHAELQTICHELAVEYVEDPSNQLTGPWRTAAGTPLRRARVRHELLPLLEDVLDGGVVGALGRTAAMLQEDGSALDFYADLAWNDVCVDAVNPQSEAANLNSRTANPRSDTVNPYSGAVNTENTVNAESTANTENVYSGTGSEKGSRNLGTDGSFNRENNAGNQTSGTAVEIACKKLAPYPRAIRTRVLRMAFWLVAEEVVN